MNFFEHQERARRQSRWLLVVFTLAVAAIVVAVNGVILLALGLISFDAETASVPFREVVRQNLPTLAIAAVVSVAFILLASLYKMSSLRGGGGEVARSLGGTQVDSSTRDPLKRRLFNVVEEIALASGVPVPEIYVLDREAGINAFAAGYTPSDAAVAVTRGALEQLDRNELQGVIAHEFSHILNGDMRINIRLMGTLFGILVLALIGRRILIHSRFVGGSSRNNGGAAIVLIAIVVMLVGYIGLFFGRWIKSAVSRQREYLADASAVQFTRDPNGIAGALKKIAVYSDASYLNVDLSLPQVVSSTGTIGARSARNTCSQSLSCFLKTSSSRSLMSGSEATAVMVPRCSTVLQPMPVNVCNLWRLCENVVGSMKHVMILAL